MKEGGVKGQNIVKPEQPSHTSQVCLSVYDLDYLPSRAPVNPLPFFYLELQLTCRLVKVQNDHALSRMTCWQVRVESEGDRGPAWWLTRCYALTESSTQPPPLLLSWTAADFAHRSKLKMTMPSPGWPADRSELKVRMTTALHNSWPDPMLWLYVTASWASGSCSFSPR